MQLIFVYGTLQHEPLLERLLGRVPACRLARLPGHRAAPLEGRVYPGLVVDDRSVAAGCLIEVTAKEAAVLDRFEGDEYERVPVVALDETGAETRCEAWLLTGASRRRVVPGDWSFEAFVRVDAGRFLDGSSAGEPHPDVGT